MTQLYVMACLKTKPHNLTNDEKDYYEKLIKEIMLEEEKAKKSGDKISWAIPSE